MRFLSLLALGILCALPARAQQVVLQAGPFVTGDIPIYSGQSGTTPIVVDSGVSVSTIPVINTGTAGQMSYFATTGTTISGNPNANIAAGALSLGITGSSLGSLKLLGSTSGTVTLAPQSAAGTWTFQLPTSAGLVNQPLLSGGGLSPMVWGTISGNTTSLASTSGALISGDCAKFDASGNVVDSGGICGVGIINVGTAGKITYYPASTAQVGADISIAVSGPTMTIGQAGTSTGQLQLTGLTSGTITLQGQSVAGTYNFNLPATVGTSGQPLLSAAGGASPMTWGSLSGNTSTFGTTSGTLTSTHLAKFDASGNIVDAGTALTPSGNTSTFATTSGALINGDCAKFDASGNVIDAGGVCGVGVINSGTNSQLAFYSGSGQTLAGAANLTISGSALTVGQAGATTGQVKVTGLTSGTITMQGQSVAGTYNFNLPITAGTANQPLVSQGGGGSAMSWGTLNGNTAIFATVSGSTTSGNCAKWDASGNVVDNGAPCAGGSASVLNWGGAPKTTNFNAAANTAYCIDTATTGALTMTLPAGPSDGDQIRFIDCTSNFAIANFTVARNGKTIMALAQNMTVNTTNAASTLIYSTTLTDWRMY